jgi:hypothetical protein
LISVINIEFIKAYWLVEQVITKVVTSAIIFHKLHNNRSVSQVPQSSFIFAFVCGLQCLEKCQNHASWRFEPLLGDCQLRHPVKTEILKSCLFSHQASMAPFGS